MGVAKRLCLVRLQDASAQQLKILLPAVKRNNKKEQ
jgi:hypothetical protein